MEFLAIALSVIMTLVCSIPLLGILDVLYNRIRFKRVEYIFDEVEKLYGVYGFETAKHQGLLNSIVDEIYLNKGLLRKHIQKRWFRFFGKIKPYFLREGLSKAVYDKAKRSNLKFLSAYIYSFMQASHIFYKGSFNYDFFQYCEEKLLNRLNSEQGYMHLCLNLTLLKNPQFTNKNYRNYNYYYGSHLDYTKCLKCLCIELMFIEYPRYEFNWNRIVSYVNNARDNIKKENSDINQDFLDELCDAYIDVLSNDYIHPPEAKNIFALNLKEEVIEMKQK